MRLLSGICSHRGRPSHPTLSSWPAFKSPGTYSAFVWFGHFPSLLLTAAYCTSPKTLNICSFPPSWGWRQSLRDFTGCPPPRPLRYLRLCLSRLPSLLSWRGTVHVPVEGYQLCLLKITLVSPTGFPAVPAVCPPSPTLALFCSLFILEKVPPPHVPMASCLHSFSCSLIHFICEFFLIILFKFAVPCLILPFSLFNFIVFFSMNHHLTCYILSLLVLCRSPL